jgi:hypothetical protein
MTLFEQGKSPKPEVTIQQITEKEGKLIPGDTINQINLGGDFDLSAAITELQLNHLFQAMKLESKELYLLSWNGTKIPHGASLKGKEIGWTQNGVVTSIEGEMIGIYDRVVEYGGEDGREHRMIVYLWADETPKK